MTARERMRNFYAKRSTRYGWLIFDIVTVGFFLISSAEELTPVLLTIDYLIAAVIGTDLAIRFWFSRSPGRFFFRMFNILDLIVLGSLLAPALIQNVAFLRVLRVLRILRSYYLLRELSDHWPWIKRNHEVVQSTLNLFVFVFVVTAFVYVFQVHSNEQINNYLDALYFTVTTLTTTGFGDITPQGSVGRLLAVVIMVVGVALFLRLVQTIFRPAKVTHPCPKCGLRRHDPDAIHCKHCGTVVHIETEGEF